MLIPVVTRPEVLVLAVPTTVALLAGESTLAVRDGQIDVPAGLVKVRVMWLEVNVELLVFTTA